MLPATNQGVGGHVGFPDVCLTPTPAGPVPIPYPNLGFSAMGVPFAPNVLVSAMPAQNMSTVKTLTMPHGGVAHPMFMGTGTYMLGNPTVQVNALPGANLALPTTGNNYNNPLGAQVVPSVTNVLFSSLASVAELLDLPGVDRRPPLTYRRSPKGVGVLRLTRCSFGAPAAARAALRALRGSRALVLDLRGNPGGALTVAADVAALFMPCGSLVGHVDFSDCTCPLTTRHAPVDTETPLWIVVDGRTASAAEVLAAALRDHGRAALVGTSTYGKGYARSLDGRCARLRSPHGAPISPAGLAPRHRLCPPARVGA